MQQLTNEEIAKVFAMYLGCEFQYIQAGAIKGTENRIGRIVGLAEHFIWFYPLGKYSNLADAPYCKAIANCKLLLTPLSKITDEHAIEVAKIAEADQEDARDEDFITRDEKCIYLNYWHKVSYEHDEWDKYPFSINLRTGEACDYHGLSNNSYCIYQQLILWHYAVPLFFGINHWANGKDAITLGIAVDATPQTLITK